MTMQRVQNTGFAERNPSQKKAIAHVAGPMMVLAGPGSGKTSVIVERIADLIQEREIPAASILVVTFSRAAAREMKERYLKRTDRSRTEVTFGTFHSIFYGILKAAYHLESGNILSEEEKLGILKELIQEYGGDLAEDADFPREIAKEIRLVKGNRIRLEHYYSSSCPDEVFRQICEGYRKVCEGRRKLDFDDMLVYCYELFVKRPDILAVWQKKFRYILVDEFQDISMDRYRFLQALRRDQPLTKLFCVGDDWQSIYRFAGSDMALFNQFEKFFGYTKRCLMETTYRFGEPAIAESSRFILVNPVQAIKKVHPFNANAETSLSFISTDGVADEVATIKSLLDQIPQDKKVIIIGRYSFDVRIFKDTDFVVHDSKDRVYLSIGKRKINYLTIHKSKGLESDYVILINCNGGTLGFPSQISDSPILKYVLSEPDAYDFSEERRVFYVGITRAKKKTWVLYDKNNPSIFIKEFVKNLDDEKNAVVSIPEAELCPKCRCGRVKVDHKGIATNGNPFSLLVCTNNKYGCDYREYRFINLNSRQRTRR